MKTDKIRSIQEEILSHKNSEQAEFLSRFFKTGKGEYADTLRIAEILVSDSEDLIHKATGWMLREIYKRNPKAVSLFLESYGSIMPRTMLRYAIELHPEKERKKLLKN